MLTAWIAPSLFGPEWVRNLAMTVVIECFVVLLSVLYGVQKVDSNSSRAKDLVPFVVFAVIFMLFIAFFSALFHTVWPLIAFVWLCVSRLASLWSHPGLTDQEDRMLSLWLVSPVFYFLGVFLIVLFVRPPPLGLTPAFIASMDVLDMGDWIAKPYYELAFGTVYFGAVALFKLLVTGKNTGPDNKIYRRDDLDTQTGEIREGVEGDR